MKAVLSLSGANPMTDCFPQKKLSEMKSTTWSLTYWLTEGRTIETLNGLVADMPTNWSLEGQIEQGYDSQDRLHAQLMLKTEQTRGTKVAKHFPSTHISEARNKFALKTYVHKEVTRKGEFKTIENRSPQWAVVVDKFFDWVVKGLYYSQHERDDDKKLEAWDAFIGISIVEGMRIDVIGVNPQYRSCIMRYWSSYYEVALKRVEPSPSVDRQTDKTEESSPSVDRQTDRQDASPGGGYPKS